jgi:two-component system NarL family sensor kinase
VTPGRSWTDNDRMQRLVGVLAVLGGLGGAGAHAVNASAGRTTEPSFWLMQAAVAVGYGLLGLALRDRTTRVLRLTVATVGIGAATSLLAYEWSMWDPAATWVVWYGSWAWAPGYVAILALLPQLLPDGRIVSPRWRPALWLGLAAVVLVGISWALWPYQDQDYPEALAQRTNPVGVDLASEPVASTIVDVVLVVAVLVAAASLVARWRAARDLERQQLKWVLLGVVATLVSAVLARLLPMPVGEVMAAVAMLPLPAAIAVAVLRHGLWDVEVVFSRSLVYGLVAGAAVGVYVAAVWLMGLAAGRRTGEVSLLAVAVLAPLLLPLHAALRRRVNRWVHGDEDEPWAELARLGDRLASVADPDHLVGRVLPEVLVRARRALRASGVRLELTDGTVLADGDDPEVGEDRAVVVPLHYAGERLGTLVVSRSGGFARSERDLIDRWAAQAAVAVHTVLLARESRRARELVVATQEEERRRLRRDLHDGVGPSVAALALHLETARDLAPDDPAAAAALLDRLVPRINAVVADVRALVDELRPPTLDDLGLVGATRELAVRLSGSTRVDVEAAELGELPAAVETAAYRIVGEAVTNAVRHAGAGSVVVRLSRAAATLAVEVSDDGDGLPTRSGGGVGLASMRNRAEELGGRCEVSGGPGGTTVSARLPLGVLAADPPAATAGAATAATSVVPMTGAGRATS